MRISRKLQNSPSHPDWSLLRIAGAVRSEIAPMLDSSGGRHIMDWEHSAGTTYMGSYISFNIDFQVRPCRLVTQVSCTSVQNRSCVQQLCAFQHQEYRKSENISNSTCSEVWVRCQKHKASMRKSRVSSALTAKTDLPPQNLQYIS